MTSPTSIARRLFGEEKALASVGVLGLVLAAACAGAALVRGTPLVAPGGDLTKPMSFDGAIGLWVLTIAALLPYADFRPRGRVLWRWSFVATMVYFYFGETYAAVRGHDPRFFSGDFGPLDGPIAALFGLTAIVVIVQFLIFASRFFTSRALERAPGVVLGVRWAVASSVVAFGVGGWMVAMQGRMVGEGGSALWPHALGFHALQAVPLVGWLGGRTGARGAVHAAGAAWLGATVAAIAQALAGRPPGEPAAASLANLAFLTLWAAALVAAWRGARSVPEAAPETLA